MVFSVAKSLIRTASYASVYLAVPDDTGDKSYTDITYAIFQLYYIVAFFAIYICPGSVACTFTFAAYVVGDTGYPTESYTSAEAVKSDAASADSITVRDTVRNAFPSIYSRRPCGIYTEVLVSSIVTVPVAGSAVFRVSAKLDAM